MDYIKKIPIPISVLMLSFSILGNTIYSFNNILGYFFAIIATFLFIVLAIKFFKFPKITGNELENTIIASILPSFSMGMIFIAVFIKDIQTNLGSIIWYLGIVLNIILILDFTMKYLFDFDIKNIYPSWLIVYTGIATLSATSKIFERVIIGRIAFYFGFITYFMVLALILLKYIKHISLLNKEKPTIAFISSSSSLLLAGYINSFDNRSINIIFLLLSISIISYLLLLFTMPNILNRKFYPSYCYYTLSFITIPYALKSLNDILISTGQKIPIFNYIIYITIFIGIVFIAYISYKLIKQAIKTVNS